MLCLRSIGEFDPAPKNGLVILAIFLITLQSWNLFFVFLQRVNFLITESKAIFW